MDWSAAVIRLPVLVRVLLPYGVIRARNVVGPVRVNSTSSPALVQPTSVVVLLML